MLSKYREREIRRLFPRRNEADVLAKIVHHMKADGWEHETVTVNKWWGDKSTTTWERYTKGEVRITDHGHDGHECIVIETYDDGFWMALCTYGDLHLAAFWGNATLDQRRLRAAGPPPGLFCQSNDSVELDSYTEGYDE